MKVQQCILAAIAAVPIAASAAQGQEMGPLPFGGNLRLNAQVEFVGYTPRAGGGGYTSRAIGTVYDNVSNTFGNDSPVHLGTCPQILEDIQFTPGPWGAGNQTTGRMFTEMTFGLGIVTTPTTNEQFMLIWWDRDDVNFQGFTGAGSNQINPLAQPIAVARVEIGPQLPGFYYQATIDLTAFPGGGMPVPDGDPSVVLQAAWFNNGCTPAQGWQNCADCIHQGCTNTTDKVLVFASNSNAPEGGNPCTVGSTVPSYGRDIASVDTCTHIGQFIGNGGAPVSPPNPAAPTTEHRYIAGNPVRGYMVSFKGDFVVPPPPPHTPLGCIPDAGRVVNTESLVTGINWYSFCINGDATDAALQFLDLDTEGSTADVAIAVYGADSNLAGGFEGAFDDDSGSGGNAQLSFGVGRRERAGDGLQYDGRHGQLTAGTYYLAVGPRGSSFGGYWNAVASSDPGGAFVLNFRTNTNGAALAPPAAPMIDGINYGTLDPLQGTLSGGTALQTGLRGVKWSTFTLASPTNGTQFLDMDFFTHTTNIADGVCYIFNANGDVVLFSDDEGTDLQPQISSGGLGARLHGDNTTPFDGNQPVGANAGLAAGTYYVAMALFQTQDLRAFSSSHRFHVRGTSGSNLNIGADIYTGPEGGQSPCCRSDYNGDGDVGTDQDIEAFFACLAGNCCATCPQDADYNCDGDVGTDQDIEAFFRVLAGNPC